jgi:hypothetical protein
MKHEDGSMRVIGQRQLQPCMKIIAGGRFVLHITVIVLYNSYIFVL